MRIMKKLLLAVLWMFFTQAQTTPGLKPYILIGESGKSLETTTSDIIRSMFMNDFEVLGKYQPAGYPDHYIFIITNPDLAKVGASGIPNSELISAIRLGLVRKGDFTYLSCQNLEYWGGAYLGENYPDFQPIFQKFMKDLTLALPKLRMKAWIDIGSEAGVTEAFLPEYHFTQKKSVFSFKKILPVTINSKITLASFDSYSSAVNAVEKKLANSGIELIFSQTFPKSKTAVYGIGLPSSFKLPDTLYNSDTRHAAFFPYEIVIQGNDLILQNPQYKIPLGFPDISTADFKQLEDWTLQFEALLKAEILN